MKFLVLLTFLFFCDKSESIINGMPTMDREKPMLQILMWRTGKVRCTCIAVTPKLSFTAAQCFLDYEKFQSDVGYAGNNVFHDMTKFIVLSGTDSVYALGSRYREFQARFPKSIDYHDNFDEIAARYQPVGFKHPRLNSRGFKYDFCIIKLYYAFAGGEAFIKSWVPNWNEERFNSETKNVMDYEKNATSYGWGANYFEWSVRERRWKYVGGPIRVKKFELRGKRIEKCFELECQYQKSVGQTCLNTTDLEMKLMMCMMPRGSKRGGMCVGDQGSPLFADDPNAVIAIFNFAYSCGESYTSPQYWSKLTYGKDLYQKYASGKYLGEQNKGSTFTPNLRSLIYVCILLVLANAINR